MSGGLNYFLDTWTVDMVDVSGQPTDERDGIAEKDKLTFKLDGTRIVCEPEIDNDDSNKNWTAAGFGFDRKEQLLRGFVQCGKELYEVLIRKQTSGGRGIECLYKPLSSNGNHNGTWHADN